MQSLLLLLEIYNVITLQRKKRGVYCAASAAPTDQKMTDARHRGDSAFWFW
jgi:hypothetical protein